MAHCLMRARSGDTELTNSEPCQAFPLSIYLPEYNGSLSYTSSTFCVQHPPQTASIIVASGPTLYVLAPLNTGEYTGVFVCP